MTSEDPKGETPQRVIRVGQRAIGADHEPFIAAEMSGNHNQSLERALAIVDAAAAAGAHALKLQTYTADTMTLDLDGEGFRISDAGSLWSGRKLYDLYAEAFTPWEWHAPIFERCRELGLIPFSSPFDASAVELLESLQAPLYKIASFELVDIPLIQACARTGKPLIMSTGMANPAEIHDAVHAAREAGCRDIVLLKCTSTYPASPEASNLATIPAMRQVFGCPVGLSDHTMGVGVAAAAVALGAVFVEKHFTLSRSDGGVDSAFSLEPPELASLVVECRRAWQAVGEVRLGTTGAEERSLQFRRSLYAVRDIPANAVIGPEDVKAIRPGMGLAPKYLEVVVGMRARRHITRGTPLDWSILG